MSLWIQRCHVVNKTRFPSYYCAANKRALGGRGHHLALTLSSKQKTQARFYHSSYACSSRISDGPGISPISAPYPSSIPVHSQDIPPLYGKTACITGGSSGIGLAIAKRYLWEGAARVILAGRDKERLITAMGHLDETMRIMRAEGRTIGPVDELGDLADGEGAPGPLDFHESEPGQSDPAEAWNTHASGHGTTFPNPLASGWAPEISHFRHVTLITGDVSNEEFYSLEVKALFDRTHILVNSAGISYSGILPLAKTDDIQRMINTNLFGTTLACRCFLHRLLKLRIGSQRAKRLRAAANPGLEHHEVEERYMQQPLQINEDKLIINISSLQALVPHTGAVTYAATKAGVITLTHGIVNELASLPKPLPVRANVIVPGYIDTDILLGMFSNAIEKGSADLTATTDMGAGVIEQARKKIPAGRLGTVNEVADAAFFLTSNKYCNGTVLNIDGGLGSRSP